MQKSRRHRLIVSPANGSSFDRAGGWLGFRAGEVETQTCLQIELNR